LAHTYLPELGTNLVTALASLDVDDFAVGGRGGRNGRRQSPCAECVECGSIGRSGFGFNFSTETRKSASPYNFGVQQRGKPKRAQSRACHGRERVHLLGVRYGVGEMPSLPHGSWCVGSGLWSAKRC